MTVFKLDLPPSVHDNQTRHGLVFRNNAHAVLFFHIYILLLIPFFLLLLQPVTVAGQTPDQPLPENHLRQVQHSIDNGGYLVSRNGRILSSFSSETSFIPASIIKIITAAAALDILGESYRFTTLFYLDPKQNLYIQGRGDPFLISEEVNTVVKLLKEKNIHIINNIFLDDTLFDLPYPADGTRGSTNPYDAANRALAVNFNTINIEVTADGTIRSAEPQTPFLPIMEKLGQNLQPSIHRINLSRQTENGLSLTGELFRAFMNDHGITGQGAISSARTPEDLVPVLIHESSKPLTEIIRELFLYSNNFIANQIFLVCGAKVYGYPATWHKARKAVADFLDKRPNSPASEIHIEEGSGLSQKNRITPRAMYRVLENFKPHARLLPVRDHRLVKSGTLTGVYSYAGYFTDGQALDSFVLILNQHNNHRDRLLDALEMIYRDHP
ncbi:D-alanyl-D-alanine carboxypeptidase/D-alanyl-D-alanine-endopeptidase [Thermodesulfobacteriota bacterium]